MMDKERIQSILSELDSYLEELEEAAPESFQKYLKSSMNRRVCERLLQISLECVIDISMLLVKGLRLGPPSDEEDALAKLEMKGIISKQLSVKLKEMKGARNVLVHGYARVDNEKIFDILENHLDDFEKFKKAVFDIVNKK